MASGYDLRTLVRIIVTSEAYQRGRLIGVDEATRQAAEEAFVSAPMRRMLSEALYDSIVQAGHLFEVKHRPGQSCKTIKTLVRIPLDAREDRDSWPRSSRRQAGHGHEAADGRPGRRATTWSVDRARFEDLLKMQGRSRAGRRWRSCRTRSWRPCR